jgi:hypothetical protein
MGIAMMIFSIVIGRVEITPEYYPAFISSMHYAFILFTILCIAGIFASLIRGRAGGDLPPASEGARQPEDGQM